MLQLIPPIFLLCLRIMALPDHLEVLDQLRTAEHASLQIIHASAAPCAAHRLHIAVIGTDDHMTIRAARLQLSQQ